jgi:hypothetical protein
MNNKTESRTEDTSQRSCLPSLFINKKTLSSAESVIVGYALSKGA